MKTLRNNVFETNSSSTHTLVYGHIPNDYLPASDKIIINFIDTNDEYHLVTLREKVSYLVSQIVNRYKYDCLNYRDLTEQVQNDYEFKELAYYVKEHFGKTIVFPETYRGEIEDIVNINHQIACNRMHDVLVELVEERNYLSEVLSENTYIEIGRD